MSIAIFGIDNNGLNLVVNLLILMMVVVWLALIVYTYLDAKRRIADPFLVGCATLASFIPYVGTAVYAIVRPPEFLEDARERQLEIKAAEMRVRQLTESSCPNCEYPIERNYLRCPQCERRLKDPCTNCRKPVDPRWSVCPYCEESLGGQGSGGERPRRRKAQPRASAAREGRAAATPSRKSGAAKAAEPSSPAPASERGGEPPAGKQPQKPKRQQRSTSREPDPDPRKA